VHLTELSCQLTDCIKVCNAVTPALLLAGVQSNNKGQQVQPKNN